MHENYQRVLLKHFDFDSCVSVANSTFSVGHSNISFSRSLGPWFCHLCFSQPSFNALKNTRASWRLNFPVKFSTKNVLTTKPFMSWRDKQHNDIFVQNSAPASTAPTKMMSQWQIVQCLHTKRQPLNRQCEPKVWQANAESKILPSGKLAFYYGKSQFLMGNSLFLWSFSIAMM